MSFRFKSRRAPKALLRTAASLVFLDLIGLSTGKAATPQSAGKEAAPNSETLKALLNQVDDNGRGQSSRSVIEMKVKTKRYQRSMKMEAWSKGSEHSLIRILEPKKDRGLSTLKVQKNLWNYLPNTDRTMRVPSAMMSGAWMGSHFTNDDVVRETRFSDDYTYALAPESKAAGSDTLTIRCTPKPRTPVVWGYVDVHVRKDGVPLEVRFYSEKKVKVRSFTYSELKKIGDQEVPMKMVVTPHDKPGEETVLIFHELELNIPVEDSLFSLQALRE